MLLSIVANLRAVSLGVGGDDAARRRDPAYARDILKDVQLPEWKPKDNVKIHVDPTEAAPVEETDEEVLFHYVILIVIISLCYCYSSILLLFHC